MLPPQLTSKYMCVELLSELNAENIFKYLKRTYTHLNPFFDNNEIHGMCWGIFMWYATIERNSHDMGKTFNFLSEMNSFFVIFSIIRKIYYFFIYFWNLYLCLKIQFLPIKKNYNSPLSICIIFLDKTNANKNVLIENIKRYCLFYHPSSLNKFSAFVHSFSIIRFPYFLLECLSSFFNIFHTLKQKYKFIPKLFLLA